MWKSKKKLDGVYKISHTSASERKWYLLMYSISRKIFWLVSTFFAVLRIRIRIRIHMFLGIPDPDPLVRGMDLDPALDPDPDPSIIMQK